MVTQSETNETDRQNREVLAAMLGESEKAPEPGTMSIKDVIHRGDDDLPTPMVTKVMTSAGYRWIYDTETGDRSLTNLNMLPMQLRKVRADGSPVYSIHKPTNLTVKRESYKCLLHKDDPERKHYDELGFAECIKANLPSPFMVEQHMSHRHRVEWQTIQAERTKKREDERWALEQAILTRAAETPAERVKRGS